MKTKILAYQLIHKIAKLAGLMERIHTDYKEQVDNILKDILLTEQELKTLLEQGE